MSAKCKMILDKVGLRFCRVFAFLFLLLSRLMIFSIVEAAHGGKESDWLHSSTFNLSHDLFSSMLCVLALSLLLSILPASCFVIWTSSS